jgi:dihydroorotase-like cyclic amidohydrolase
MASTVIKGGTIVTADLSYEADVKIEGGVITEIGKGLKGDTTLDATGCYGRRCRVAPRWSSISCCRGRGRA